MLSLKLPARRRGKDDGEKPFWISFADMMSALMVLFLVAMTVALLAVTKKVSEAEREEAERTEAIKTVMRNLGMLSSKPALATIRVDGNTIDLGKEAIFEREGQYTLSPLQRERIRAFLPELLRELRADEKTKKWFKRAVVEGYASRTGSYLFNLNLSLRRSERVLCELLLADSSNPELPFEDRKFIAQRFFVGGASFNELKSSQDAESRRIQFKLEFKTRQELKEEEKGKPASLTDEELAKALNPQEKCPI